MRDCSITDLATTTALNRKVTETEKEFPSITGSFTTAALNVKITEIENKIPNTIGLVKKTNSDKKLRKLVT